MGKTLMKFEQLKCLFSLLYLRLFFLFFQNSNDISQEFKKNSDKLSSCKTSLYCQKDNKSQKKMSLHLLYLVETQATNNSKNKLNRPCSSWKTLRSYHWKKTMWSNFVMPLKRTQ